MNKSKLLAEFEEKLEWVLDEHFPKIDEEGEEKRLNKRGAALVLFGEAVLLADKILSSIDNNIIRTDRLSK